MDLNLTAIGAILVGIVLCFAGFKVQKFLITLAWFVLGFMLAKELGNYLTFEKNVLLVIQLVVGIIMGSLGYKLEKLALFIAVSYLVYMSFGPYVGNFIKEVDANVLLIIKVVISLTAGALSTLFIKPIIIIVSSLAGSSLIKENLPSLIKLPNTIVIILVLIIFAAGVIIQFKND